MRENIFLKLLCSIPVIFVFLYFIPFLGICLILLRYFICNNRKRLLTPILLIVVGIIILIPKFLDIIFNMINFNTNIPYFNDIINSKLYSIHFIKYSKFLLTVGIIFLIISFIFKSLLNKFENFISSYINSQVEKDAEISQKNDLIMKEKREKAKNTHIVYCPYCGSDNILTEEIGRCKYCRRQIVAK